MAVLPPVFESQDQSFEKSLQFATSFGTQFCILYKRKLKQMSRDNVSRDLKWFFVLHKNSFNKLLVFFKFFYYRLVYGFNLDTIYVQHYSSVLFSSELEMMEVDHLIILSFASVCLYFSCIHIPWLQFYCVSFHINKNSMCYEYLITGLFSFTVPEEVKLLEREYFNRWYSLKAYYMVTLVTTLPNLVGNSR